MDVRNAPENLVDDAELVQQVLAGRQDAYASLVNRHQQGAYRHAVGMGLDHDTSLDLVQDAFIKAYERLDECRDPAHFRAWLFRICRNLCLDHLKNVRRLSVPMSTLPGVQDIADQKQADVDLTYKLRHALDELPVSLREAFLLKHDAGYSYEEIAAMTDASVSAVKMRVHRARETLCSSLLDEDEYAA
jgi:RNA polymerase sigma-70 factor (ECF subfamily)